MKPEDQEAYRKACWEWATNSGGKDLGEYMFESALAHRDAQPSGGHMAKEIEFGMNGEKMFFRIGVQQFTLDYAPELTEDFEFMKKALTDAITSITHGVKVRSAVAVNEQIPGLLWALYHHQGGDSPVGQPIRAALGIGQHDRLTDEQIVKAKQWAEAAKGGV